MKADILRKKFLEFFKNKKHRIVESDSLVPKDDPTVLFTPAGMNQFKKEFLGFDSGFKRAATSQRCLRTDDLDKVGKTTGHHTFFEMLGNFSFGDYFKREAISWAWEFLTKELKINPDKLWVSVYKDDDEAYGIWLNEVKVPSKKIVKLGDKENFWPSEAKEKGPNGPCGPCSEIFYDFGKETGCGEAVCDPSCSCGRFVEIWNLVFTQFNRKEGGRLEPLPNKNIDTGMGLERLAAIMQGVPNNFKTDLFIPLVKEIQKSTENRAQRTEELTNAVADHIRAVVFSVYDGVLPSNEGRGYVIRKIIRKSCLALRAMGIKKPFFYKLVPVLAEIMAEPYPDLMLRKEDISEVVLSEEKSFIAVLNTSEALLKEKFLPFFKNQDPEKTGKLAFQLHDTYGMPLELTIDWLKKNGILFSQQAFDRELEIQKTRSKNQSTMKGDVFAIKELDYGVKETKFSGYKKFLLNSEILKVYQENSEVKKLSLGESGVIILKETPFYPEAGGQVADTGFIKKGKNVFEVLDTKKSGKVILHIGRVKSGSFKKKDLAQAEINLERRLSIARNHTATHLLQAALRKVLGQHVQQQGSLVSDSRLRFDFTHFKDVSDEELSRIEEFVNEYVMNNLKVDTGSMALKEAKKTGALAFFGEKYGSKVRIVSVGNLSKEFCGGTHLGQTGQIGLFKILQESSVASNVRRIEATTGIFAYRKVKEEEVVLSDVSKLLNTGLQNITQEVERRSLHIKELEKQLNAQKLSSVRNSLDDLIKDAKNVNGKLLITKVFEDVNMELLRKNIDLLKEKSRNTVIALASVNQGKVLLVMGVTNDLCDKGIDAGMLIREVSGFIGGSGGGRKDFAQAGGSKPENLEQAFGKLREII
ncbi:MAG: alanine--tRNA ligase [Candidatus Omnitrophica bacterium]|nr:alanine--tRNA ligase [Candidatus Omnitrophota bacterium]